ncbi:MAG TPA: hypothetical protein VMY18_12165, partial [Acidobacteriota bacterium]|nr:hypothetical protein [Acidobacteriota bacterium]
MDHLKNLVIQKIRDLGVEKAGEFFDVNERLVRQWLSGSKSISLVAAEKTFDANLAAGKEDAPDRASEGRLVQADWDGKDV